MKTYTIELTKLEMDAVQMVIRECGELAVDKLFILYDYDNIKFKNEIDDALKEVVRKIYEANLEDVKKARQEQNDIHDKLYK